MIEGAGGLPVLSQASRCGMVVLLAVLLGGCSETTRTARASSGDWWRSVNTPDELPQMLNAELPFRYPLPEYSRRIEGNVMLRLFVDTSGMVIPDSTRISESSGRTAFDRAALSGASRLRFRPARRGGLPIAVSLMYPVHFRHPEGASAPTHTDSTAR